MRTVPALLGLALAALALAPALPARADELTPEKRAAIRKLMDITGSANLATQMAGVFSQGMFRALKAAKSDIPERALEVLDQEVRGLLQEKLAEPGSLFDRIIPVYHQHFSADEIAQLITFYESPIGKKAIAELPAIMQESMEAGQRWGESLAPEIRARVKAALKREKLLPEEKQ